MTEFEMAYLLTDMQSALANVTAIQITIITGFLVASYVAAHRLSVSMLSVALPLYTLFYFGNAFMISRMQISLIALVKQIHDFADAGKGLQWHAAASSIAPAWWFDIAGYVLWGTNLFIYAATIVFFIQCRRYNHKTEASMWKPKV